MRTVSRVATCAKAIRQDLKKKYPGITFGVTSENYSGGDSVHVEWADGPVEEIVVKLLSKYEQGHFDGMTDMYEYSNPRHDIPQTKYLFCTRSASNERLLQAIEWVNANVDTITPVYLGQFGEILGELDPKWNERPGVLIHRMLSGYYKTRPEMDFSK